MHHQGPLLSDVDLRQCGVRRNVFDHLRATRSSTSRHISARTRIVGTTKQSVPQLGSQSHIGVQSHVCLRVRCCIGDDRVRSGEACEREHGARHWRDGTGATGRKAPCTRTPGTFSKSRLEEKIKGKAGEQSGRANILISIIRPSHFRKAMIHTKRASPRSNLTITGCRAEWLPRHKCADAIMPTGACPT